MSATWMKVGGLVIKVGGLVMEGGREGGREGERKGIKVGGLVVDNLGTLEGD
jgi:hypothetical protein